MKKILQCSLFLLTSNVLTAQNFTEVIGTPFNGVMHGSIAFSDIDGDNDQDVLITGQSIGASKISKLYTNDGSGNFTEVMGTPFEGVEFSSIAFSDIDGDNDQDVLITGAIDNGMISKLYTNDGNGNFTEVTETPFDGVRYSSIAFSDVDGDNDQDVLITGWDSNLDCLSKLYTNDGNGIFTEVIGTPFEGVSNSSIAFSDIDGDNDQDLLITGYSYISSSEISKLYINDGNGNFTEDMDASFLGVRDGSVAFADIDGDNDQDLLITGEFGLFGTNYQDTSSQLYINDGSGNFIGTEDPFVNVMRSSVVFFDVDNDNDQDVLIAGGVDAFLSFSILYTNDGNGNFSEVTEASLTLFTGVQFSSIAISNIDGDNNQDILLTGQSNSDRVTKLYVTQESSVSTQEFNNLNKSIVVTGGNLLQVTSSKNDPIKQVRIFDITGALVYQTNNINSNKFEWNNNSTNTIYLIVINTKFHSSNQKVFLR